MPDTRRPDFAEECRRQSRLAAQADMADKDMQQFMDEALADVDGWTE
ncbi:MAG: antitoxin MazE-like protein [Nitrosospira sp.]